MTLPAEAPFASRLRQAIIARGFSLRGLAAVVSEAGVPVSGTTLSYWQRGLTRPGRETSRRLLPVLEEALALPSGTLIEALTLTEPAPDGQRVPQNVVMARVRRLWNLPDTDGLHRELVVGRSDVCEDLTQRYRFRMVLRAERSGADRILVVVYRPHGVPCIPAVRPLAGCSVGREFYDPEFQVRSFEILLPCALARGAARSIEVGLESDQAWAPDDPDFRVRTLQPVDILLAQVAFPSLRHPRHVTLSADWIDTDGVPHVEERPGTLLTNRIAQMALTNVGFGGMRISW